MRDRGIDKDRKRRRSRSRSNGRDRDEEKERRKKSHRDRSNSRNGSKSRSPDRRARRERERERRSRSRSNERTLPRSKSNKDLKDEKPKVLVTDEEQEKSKQKEAELSQLEEEMKKRRERVRLWQEAKAKQQSGSIVSEEANNQDTASSSADQSASGELAGPSQADDQSKKQFGEQKEAEEVDSGLAQEMNQEEEDKPTWNLEDDDEEDDAVPDTLPAPSVDSTSLLLGPIKQSETEEDAALLLRSPMKPVSHQKLADGGSGGKRRSRFEDTEPLAPVPPLAEPPFRAAPVAESKQALPEDEEDPLEQFMRGLLESGQVAEQKNLKSVEADTIKKPEPNKPSLPSSILDDPDDNEFGTNMSYSNVITLDEIMKGGTGGGREERVPRGWESDVGESASNSPVHFVPMDVAEAKEETEEEREAREEKERQEFLDAIKKAREEEEMLRQKLLKMDEEIVQEKKKKTDELGRVFGGDGDIVDEMEMEEKRRSALEMLEEAKKGKVLKPVDHSKIIYIPFRKNLYIVPKSLAKLTEEQIVSKRDMLQVKVRGKGCPAPVDLWEQCGLSDRILQCIYSHKLKEPFAIQKQAIPAIMAGRDVIGVAKTGSGKTLAFLLPLFRHIQDQPPLGDSEGPIGLIMAPARELAFQIYNEAKKFTKVLGMRVACIYGGAGVAEQIADLKRGSEIVVCTPGRMIDILTMQAGKLVSLKRVTMVILDEADRMFDMGFEPQIKMIMQNIRPERQTILFSATFPKQIEKLAKTVLKLPIEIIVGERSTVNKDITQYVEVHEEEDKFLRLLQLLGIWYEKGSILVFVDKQEKCDQLFQELLKLGYPSLSLHGGKDQVDRDHTLHEFKTGIKKVMIATSVAGRGLDVPEIICVINYNCPNHLEDYVHRVGRTGRAGRKGSAYTFVSSKEDQYAPIMVKALQKAGQEIPSELAALANVFKEKVERGEAHYSTNGFVGKGFTFDASEMNETQKIAAMQKKAYEIEQGLVPDEVDADADDEFEGDAADERATATKASATANAPASGGALSAVEKAKALANSLGNTVSTSTATGAANPLAALAKARQIAAQLAGTRAPDLGDAAPPARVVQELDINDYPASVRKKVMHKSTFDDIIERTGVYIVCRGSYLAPNKKPEPGEKRLHLVLESDNEMSVRQARMDLLRMLEEETIKLSAQPGIGGGGGRYSVV